MLAHPAQAVGILDLTPLPFHLLPAVPFEAKEEWWGLQCQASRYSEAQPRATHLAFVWFLSNKNVHFKSVVVACNPSTWSWGRKILSLRSAWATQWDPVPKQQKMPTLSPQRRLPLRPNFQFICKLLKSALPFNPGPSLWPSLDHCISSVPCHTCIYLQALSFYFWNCHGQACPLLHYYPTPLLSLPVGLPGTDSFI
jgi:hypothetical protein